MKRLLLLSLVAGWGGLGLAYTAPDIEADRLMTRGLQLLYEADYGEAERFFLEESAKDPEEPLPWVGLLFLYHLQMYEVDDLSRIKEFKAALGVARRLAKRKVTVRGSGWDSMIEGAVQGMSALLEARQEHWISAVRKGLRAKKSLKVALSADPELWDCYLGIGAIDYFGSVATKDFWILPGFSDQRRRGREAVELARARASYVRPLSEFVLLYIYYEEKEFESALALAHSLESRYPGNALAMSWVGWLSRRQGEFSSYLDAFERVAGLGENRFHSLYNMGYARYLAGGDLDLAKRNLRAFLAAGPSARWQARAYYRMSLIHERQGRPASARRALLAATYIDPGYAPAKRRLQRHGRMRPKE